MTLKDVPPPPRPEGVAFVVPPDTIVIASGFGLLLIEALLAGQLENLTEPKLARGSTPLLLDGVGGVAINADLERRVGRLLART